MKLSKLVNGNSYYNQQLDFYIEKPEEWSFMPKEWAINMKETTLENNPELKDILEKAARPFLSFHLFHDNPQLVYPSVNCSCRLIRSGLKFDPKKHLDDSINLMDRYFTNFKVIQAFDDFIISGYQGIFLKVSLDVLNSDNIPIKCLNRLIAINRPLYGQAIVYNIGLSGNYNDEYCCEEDFDKIMKSIAIG